MKKNYFIKSALMASFLTFVYFITIPVCSAQEENGMLIFQVDGNRYTRKNYDKNGTLKNYQTIEVGKAEANGDKIETKVTVISHEADGTITEASQAKLVCTPESRQILMGIFPFAGEKSKTSLTVEMDDNAIMYPSGWRQLSELKDFSFKLNFSGGTAGFFGTKSNVSIINRKVVQSGDLSSVSGKFTMKAFVFGIKIATVRYDFYEEIDEERGLVLQKFTEESGDYFITELTN